MPETNPIPFYPQAKIVDHILEELKRLKQHEPFPDHICAQSNRVTAAAGNLARIANNVKYNKEHRSEAYNAAVSVAAQALRFLENL